MDELTLNPELYNNIVDWMIPRYATSTVRQRKILLLSLFKKYKVLNRDTLKQMMKKFKHQYQKACLVMINNYCYDNNIDFNLTIPKIKRAPSKIPEILSEEEIKLMINSAPYPYDLVIRCIFNMGAGLRISEIIKLSWRDIRWVDWLHNKNNYGVAVLKMAKGDKERVVNIPPNLMKDLYDYAKEKEVLNEFGIPTGGKIFYFSSQNNFKKRKRRLKIPVINNEWKLDYVNCAYDWFRYNIIQKHCEKALNKRIKVHSLRHSRATYLYTYEGVPIEKLQVLLGHSSINTTMIYVKVDPKGIFDSIKNAKEL